VDNTTYTKKSACASRRNEKRTISVHECISYICGYVVSAEHEKDERGEEYLT
jgi:hypothetical protein